MKLDEYQTAKTAFQAGASLAPEDSRFTNFIKECEERIAGIIKMPPFLFLFFYFVIEYVVNLIFI